MTNNQGGVDMVRAHVRQNKTRRQRKRKNRRQTQQGEPISQTSKNTRGPNVMSIRGGGDEDPTGSPTPTQVSEIPSPPGVDGETSGPTDLQPSSGDVQESNQEHAIEPTDGGKVEAHAHQPTKEDAGKVEAPTRLLTQEDVDKTSGLVRPQEQPGVDKKETSVRPTQPKNVDQVEAPIHSEPQDTDGKAKASDTPDDDDGAGSSRASQSPGTRTAVPPPGASRHTLPTVHGLEKQSFKMPTGANLSTPLKSTPQFAIQTPSSGTTQDGQPSDTGIKTPTDLKEGRGTNPKTLFRGSLVQSPIVRGGVMAVSNAIRSARRRSQRLTNRTPRPNSNAERSLGLEQLHE